MDLVIEKNIPIPPSYQKKVHDISMVLLEMKTGDSFVVNGVHNVACARRCANLLGGRVIGKRIEGAQYRVWMIQECQRDERS